MRNLDQVHRSVTIFEVPNHDDLRILLRTLGPAAEGVDAEAITHADRDRLGWVLMPHLRHVFIEVTHDFDPAASDGRKFGEYEMLVYRLRAQRIPEPSTGVLLTLVESLAA